MSETTRASRLAPMDSSHPPTAARYSGILVHAPPPPLSQQQQQQQQQLHSAAPRLAPPAALLASSTPHLVHHAAPLHALQAPPPLVPAHAIAAARAHDPVAYYELYIEAAAHARRLQEALDGVQRELECARERIAQLERAKPEPPRVQSRYWTPDEHARFLDALDQYGAKDVRAIAGFVGTRNATQVRTHAQKYFLRKAREAKGGSALQAARKRSMSESDLARVERASRTPPGSPVKREMRFALPKPTSHSTDVTMTSASPHQPLPPPVPTFGARALPLGKPALSIPCIINPPAAKRAVSGGKPPAPARSVLADNAGINLLSLVASERDMQSLARR